MIPTLRQLIAPSKLCPVIDMLAEKTDTSSSQAFRAMDSTFKQKVEAFNLTNRIDIQKAAGVYIDTLKNQLLDGEHRAWLESFKQVKDAVVQAAMEEQRNDKG